jgi:ferritin-like protein
MAAGTQIVIADGDADSAQVAAFERDRRELIRRGLGLGGAVVAASAVPLLLAVRNAFADSDTDGTILERAITLERVAVLAYDTILGGDALTDRIVGQVRLLRGHEQQHADVMTKALTDLGGTPPPAPSGVKDVDKVVKGLSDVRTQADVLSFAIELETALVAAYYDAQAKLVEAKLLQTAASIMADEGQHLVVLRQAAGRPPVPNALETGEH